MEAFDLLPVFRTRYLFGISVLSEMNFTKALSRPNSLERGNENSSSFLVVIVTQLSVKNESSYWASIFEMPEKGIMMLGSSHSDE